VRCEPPGEWGKLLGLNRLPEVKTMRQKIATLCASPRSPDSMELGGLGLLFNRKFKAKNCKLESSEIIG
jgi:hypothetical protein